MKHSVQTNFFSQTETFYWEWELSDYFSHLDRNEINYICDRKHWCRNNIFISFREAVLSLILCNHWEESGAILENGAISEDGAIFPFIIMFRNKWLHPIRWTFFFRRKQLHLWRWCQNSATGGAVLHTMKWLQGWRHFGSTFFLSDM